MIIRKEIDLTAPLTEEQILMLKEMDKMPITFDEDCPELTEEQLKQFRRASEVNHRERNKQNVTLRLSPQALRKAKSLGKGYTSVLSRILESALKDNDTIQRYL